MYETLANDTRIRFLHVLLKEVRSNDSDLEPKLEIKPQAVSNQLQRLSDRGIVRTRRNDSLKMGPSELKETFKFRNSRFSSCSIDNRFAS